MSGPFIRGFLAMLLLSWSEISEPNALTIIMVLGSLALLVQELFQEAGRIRDEGERW